MEEILVVVFQLFFEFVLQLIGSGLVTSSTPTVKDKTLDGCATFFLHAAIGGLCGFLSTLFAPKFFLPHAGLRIANLLVSPMIAGGLSMLFARWLGWRSQGSSAFWHGFLFAIMFGAARLAFVHR